MEKETKQTTGSLRISEDVLATIAVKAASGVEGVVLSPERNTRTVFRGQSGKAVRIDSSEDTVALDISLSIKYGCGIRAVCEAVQKAVKEDIQTMTGMTVAKVNVSVQDIVLEDKE